MGAVCLYVTAVAATLFAVTWAVQGCPPSDLVALMAFKSALHESKHGIFNSWVGTNCCHNWKGISCDPQSRRVADINLRGESEDPIYEKTHRTGYMTGTISPAICRLTRLSSVTISDWKGITGQIPKCITTLPFLRILDLIGNRISGEIPSGIGRLHRLTVLNVADNLISGPIPASLTNLSSLMHLDLRNNKISGELPQDFGRLGMLSRALLSRNLITGTIPSSISQIYRLADLDLSLNKLSGPIPATIGKMAVLATLNLDCNNISGRIPPSLIVSAVSNLNLSRNSLSGLIPDVFGPRSYFTAIDLAFNKLRGAIPKSIVSASYIGHLDLRAIKLFGKKISLPADIEDLGFARPVEKEVEVELEEECEEEEEDAETEQDSPSQKSTESIEQDDGPQPKSEDPTNLETLPGSVVNPKTPSIDEESAQTKTAQTEKEQSTENSEEKTLKKPDKILPCPRCNSMDTKFCYYNNYNVNQPRHFCKACQRYWTAGGTMRNVPVGAGRRKNKNSASHYRHMTISEALEAARIDAPNGVHHPALKSNGRVLSFGVDAPICDSMASSLNPADKKVPNGTRNGLHKSEEEVFPSPCKARDNGDDSSSASSVNVSKPHVQNVNGFSSQIPCLPGVPWPYPWNAAVPPPAFCPPGFPLSFCPAPYWNCGVPGAWNVPWFGPQPASPNQKSPRSGSNSPTLGKHSRDEDVLKPEILEKEEPSRQKNGCVLVPKTLRIDDPSEAAKSSIWATLGIKNDSISGGGLFKAFQSKSDKKKTVSESSPALRANPAALSRSLNFHESS